jgi:hypothetical protein
VSHASVSLAYTPVRQPGITDCEQTPSVAPELTFDAGETARANGRVHLCEQNGRGDRMPHEALRAVDLTYSLPALDGVEVRCFGRRNYQIGPADGERHHFRCGALKVDDHKLRTRGLGIDGVDDGFLGDVVDDVESENQIGTQYQEVIDSSLAPACDPDSPLEQALQQLSGAIKGRLLMNKDGGMLPAT